MTEIATSSNLDRLPGFETRFRDSILTVNEFRGDLSLEIQPDSIRDIAMFLKDELDFKVLVDLFGMDYSKYAPNVSRLCVYYIFNSLSRRVRVRLRASLAGDSISSLCSVFSGANWYEREAWDLFGIRFEGHPNLSRILCHGDFKGHALLKSYPADHYQRLKGAIPSAEL